MIKYHSEQDDYVFLDRTPRRYLRMSGKEFLERYDRGELHTCDPVDRGTPPIIGNAPIGVGDCLESG